MNIPQITYPIAACPIQRDILKKRGRSLQLGKPLAPIIVEVGQLSACLRRDPWAMEKKPGRLVGDTFNDRGISRSIRAT